MGEAIEGAETPVFYLEIPPFLFGTVVKGLAEAGPDARRRASSSRSRSATTRPRPARSPTSCTSTSTSRSSPDRPLPREDGARGDPLPPLREHDARAGLEPELRRVRPDHDGGGLRRRGPRPLLRPGRRAARRRRQPPHAGRRADRDGAARRRRPEDAQGREGRALPRDQRRPTRRTTCAASTTATSRIDGVAPDSTTETYAALRLEIDNWRWSGVPFFIRTGKRLPVTQTEVRLVFKHPPRLGFAALDRRPEPNQLVIKLDPSTGVRIVLDAHRADARAARADHARHGVRREGRRGRDAVRGAAPRRDGRREHPLHAPGRRRGDVADHAAAARRAAAGSRVRARLVGPRGRRRARRRPRPLAAIRGSSHERRPRQRPSRGRRARPRPRRSRRSRTTRFLSNCHTGALVAPDGAIDWLCVPALRLAERLRQPARPRRRVASGSGRSTSTIRPRARTSRGRTSS